MTALKRPDLPGFTPRTLDATLQLSQAQKPLAQLRLGALSVDVQPGRDTLWIVVRREGKGGVALKTARSAGSVEVTGRKTRDGGEWRVSTESGRFTVKLSLLTETSLRVTVTLAPSTDLLVPFWSRDLYPLGAGDDPRRAKGRVEAAQRGLNAGLCYFTLEKPAFGSVLYVQNLTALNPYFRATATTPDGVVGGEWPELGYQPPTAPMGNSPPTKPLPRNQAVVISDAILAFREAVDLSEAESAVQFVEMMAEIYPFLDKPKPEVHDWCDRARRTLRDLQKSPQSAIEHYGQTYLHPYTEAEYPDSMVQMSIISTLRTFEQAWGQSVPFTRDLAAGMSRFFSKELGCLRRYLPNVGKDKNRNAVDSWYLYHPLHNLGRLALAGDDGSRQLFLGSMDYAIKAAQHFKYQWPIQYDIRNFSVIDATRKDGKLGQTDVGGLYAYVMLQAYELTSEARYLSEAKAALRALEDIRFELVYQTNLTAWGAAACVRLWLMVNEAAYLAQAHIFVAGFFHNCVLWNSEIAHARHYPTFFGATCLHDAPYMSAYECYESFWAFDELLDQAGERLPRSLRMLLLEYRRYTLDRAWYFYPDALPPEAIEQEKIRNGHIDRRLSFPLEDVYADGQNAGQVGQEVYGAGGAFIFACRAFHERKGVPFRIFTSFPATIEKTAARTLRIRLHAPSDMTGDIVLMTKNRSPLPRLRMQRESDGQACPALRRTPETAYFEASGGCALTIAWTPNRS